MPSPRRRDMTMRHLRARDRVPPRAEYPPFSRLVKLTYAGPNDKRAREEAARLEQILTTRCAQLGLPALDLIGPRRPFFTASAADTDIKSSCAAASRTR